MNVQATMEKGHANIHASTKGELINVSVMLALSWTWTVYLVLMLTNASFPERIYVIIFVSIIMEGI